MRRELKCDGTWTVYDDEGNVVGLGLDDEISAKFLRAGTSVRIFVRLDPAIAAELEQRAVNAGCSLAALAEAVLRREVTGGELQVVARRPGLASAPADVVRRVTRLGRETQDAARRATRRRRKT